MRILHKYGVLCGVHIRYGTEYTTPQRTRGLKGAATLNFMGTMDSDTASKRYAMIIINLAIRS